MRRSLVLTDETARHPFRASLPPHWRSEQNEGPEKSVPWRVRLGLSSEDVRGFLLAYTSCLVAVTTFLV
jgi:hypothetical protein